MNKKAAVVILNYNNAGDTLECIRSLQKSEYEQLSIIIVDNASADSSVKKIKEEFPAIYIIENRVNLGYAAGNNVGIDAALESGSDYIMILNNDTVVNPGSLGKMIETMEQDKNIAVSGPVIYENTNKDKVWSAGGSIKNLRPKNITDLQYSDEIDFLTGCCMLFRRSALEDIGSFDPDFFLFNEDVDISLRIKKEGYKLHLVKDAYIYHKVSRSTGGELSALSKYYGIRNRILLVKKHYGLYDKLYFYVIILPLTVIKNIVVLSFKKDALLAFLQGLKDGLKGKYGKKQDRN